MAQSISKAQASLISSGFLSHIGSTEEFEPSETLSALVELSALLIETAQENLHIGGQISTGELSDSFKVNNPKTQGKIIQLDIEAAFYFDFQNKGVRGIGGGASGAGYSFKNAFPSPAMVEAISQWIKRAGSSTANVKKSVSNLESKNKSISDYDNAYAVARSIKIKGIRGTGYLDRAINVAQQYAGEVLGTALRVDIINSLPKTLNSGNSNQRSTG